jgi:hypothetical protein
MSCKVTAIAAAILLDLNIHATPMESSVFKLQSGVNPKKIPMAEPRAIEWGVSAIVIRVTWCAASHAFRRTSGLGNGGPARDLGASTRYPSSKQFRRLRRQRNELTQSLAQPKGCVRRIIASIVVKDDVYFFRVASQSLASRGDVVDLGV